jgi:hypothetical protein
LHPKNLKTSEEKKRVDPDLDPDQQFAKTGTNPQMIRSKDPDPDPIPKVRRSGTLSGTENLIVLM